VVLHKDFFLQERKFGVEKLIPRCICSNGHTEENAGHAFSVSC